MLALTRLDDGGDGRMAEARSALTRDQLNAVDAPANAVCVLAGAGSGKTRVLTLRVAQRIEDGTADADHTVVCTFTRKAASELRGRLRGFGVVVAVPGGASSTRTGPGPGARVGTLHQLALTLLRRHALDAGDPPPQLIEHRLRLLVDAVGDLAVASALDAEIGWAKANCLAPDTYSAAAEANGRRTVMTCDEVAEHFVAYQARLGRRRALDLDDVLVRAGDLVHQDAGFAEAVRWRYRHLSVDEFQDVNPAQFRLVQSLLGERNDLFAVGDPNQAIYGWNGADPGLLVRLPDLIPGMQVIRLTENHRSTPEVVAAAAAALGKLANGVPRSTGPSGPMPTVTGYDDEVDEAEGVASHLALSAGNGRRWADHAVLARTNGQLAAIRSALHQAGIPFRVEPEPEAPGRAGAEARPDDAVELVTFHRAKGLEWPWVAVVGIEDGLIPIVHATTELAIDEERRLLYVAITRAEVELYCSWARARRTRGGQSVERQPSPWLASIARVSMTGNGRVRPLDTKQRFAQLRAGLRPR